MLSWWDSTNRLRCSQVKVDHKEFQLEASTQVQIIPQWWEIQIIYRIIMHKTIYKFQFKLLKRLREESPRIQWKVTELFKKPWADNRHINSELILLRITPKTKATNQEMDQMDQLQELSLIPEEIIAQEDQSAALQDQVPDPELMEESPAPKTFSAWSNAHVSQIFKMSKTPDEILSKLTEAKNNNIDELR